MLFVIADRLKPVLPQLIEVNISGQLLVFDNLRVYPRDQHFFVVAAVKNTDPAAFR